MTLQKFSDKSFLSMLVTRLKSAVFFPIVGLLILSIYAVALPFSEIIRLNTPGMYYGDFLQLENVKYVIFNEIRHVDGYFPDAAVVMYMTVIIAAILCAIMVFKDLSNKKTANVYYSLGFSRTRLFLSTYLAGAVSILGMVVFPFLISFIINAFGFGISKELLSAIIFTVSCLCNVSLIAYTVSSIAMTLSGMFVEGAFFSFFLNSITPIFTFSSCMFSDGLLTGGGFVEAAEYYYGTFENSFMSAFIGKLSFLNALSHSAMEVNRLGCCIVTSDVSGLEGYLSLENWTTPKFVPLLVWSIVLAGLVFLAVCVFNRKKAENIGFFASSRILYHLFFGTLVVGFSSLGCSAGRAITKGLTWLYVLIILVICIIIVAILTLILSKLSRIKFKKEVKVFGIYSLVVIAFAAIFSTGFFGYTNRIPDIKKVASVTITGLMEKAEYSYPTEINGNDWSLTPVRMEQFDTAGNYLFTTSADITNVQELHKSLIKADGVKLSQKYRETKIGAIINIKYTLKNGKTISRSYYRITPEIVDKYTLYNGIGKEIKSDMITYLSYAIQTVVNTDDYYDGPSKFITLFSNDLTKAHNVDLSNEQLNGLIDAYAKDVTKLSVTQLLKPTAKCLGVITVRDDFDTSYDDGEGNVINTGFYSETQFEEFDTSNGYAVTINENMENTIKWAKDAGIYKFFAKDYETEIVLVEAVHNNSSFIKLALSDNIETNLMFCGASTRNVTFSNYDYETGMSVYANPLAGSHYVNGLTKEEIKHLRDNAHPFYLTTDTGYFIKFTTDEENTRYSVVFVPDSKLTPELKTKLALNSDKINYAEDVTHVGTYEEERTVTVPHSSYTEETTYMEIG